MSTVPEPMMPAVMQPVPQTPTTEPVMPDDFQGNAAYPIPQPDASEDVHYDMPSVDPESIMTKEPGSE